MSQVTAGEGAHILSYFWCADYDRSELLFNQALSVTSDSKGGIPHFYLDFGVQTTIAACCFLIKPQVSQVTVEEGAHISILILVCRLRSQRAAFFIKPQASQVTAGEGAHITISFQSKCWWGQDSHS